MNSTELAPSSLKTKTHFQILDGLRGIAAFAVVIFHFMEIAVPDSTSNFIAHGYLAVDFFFCLSGFVIAYAYDNRIEKIGAVVFFKLRLIRLHPLVVIGSVLGLLTFIFDPFRSLYEAHGLRQTVLMFVTSCLMIPYPVVPERYYNLFHFNPPTWSLFYEYIANIVYALILFKLPTKLLWVLTALAALALGYTAHHYTNLSVGWGVPNLGGGFARVCFSFLAGMLVYRANWIVRSSLGFPAVGLLLSLVFLVPYVNGFNQYTESLIVLVYFPFLLALGVGAQLTSRFQRMCAFLGDISYPLYMIHYPFIWVFFSYVEAKKPTMPQLEIIIPIASLLLVGFAYVVMVYADTPIRNYLTKRLRKA